MQNDLGCNQSGRWKYLLKIKHGYFPSCEEVDCKRKINLKIYFKKRKILEFVNKAKHMSTYFT